MAARVELREISRGGQSAAADRAPRQRLGGDLAAGADRACSRRSGCRPPQIAEVVFSDPDTVREVIHNFNRDGFEALYPRYGVAGRGPSRCPSASRSRRSRSRSRPTSASRLRPGAWPSSPTTWSPRGWSTDISHEGLRQLLREEGVCFQAVRSWKRSNDPDFEAKKNRILELYELAEPGRRRS